MKLKKLTATILATTLFLSLCCQPLHRVYLDGFACSIEMPTDMKVESSGRTGVIYVNKSSSIFVMMLRSDNFENLFDFANNWIKRFQQGSFTNLKTTKINKMPAVYHYAEGLEGKNRKSILAYIDAGTHYYLINIESESQRQAEKIMKSFKVDKNKLQKLQEPAQDESLSLYNLAYIFIPYLAGLVWSNELVHEALLDREWIMDVAEEVSFEWSGFAIERISTASNSDGIYTILYTLPEPQKSPEAKFAMLSISKQRGSGIYYYTLEKMADGGWFLGGIDIIGQVNDGRLNRVNFGKVDYAPTAQNFKRDVLERLKNPMGFTATTPLKSVQKLNFSELVLITQKSFSEMRDYLKTKNWTESKISFSASDNCYGGTLKGVDSQNGEEVMFVVEHCVDNESFFAYVCGKEWLAELKQQLAVLGTYEFVDYIQGSPVYLVDGKLIALIEKDGMIVIYYAGK
jgi:hypothetical protein